MPSLPLDSRRPGTAAAWKGVETRVEQIALALGERIRNGELAAGTRLPSLRTQARQAAVSVQTVLRAYDKLVALGHLEARRGSGFYVKHRRRGGTPPPHPDLLGNATSQDWRMLLASDRPYPQRIGGGSLPDAWLDRKALAAAMRAVAPAAARAASDYADVQGYLPLRQQLQLQLRDYGIEADPAQIMVTAGAVDALHLLIWSNLLHPGSPILIEDPAPPVQLQRLLAGGLEIVRIARDSDGPDLGQLRQACLRHRPRMLLCSSLLHNPTSYCLSLDRAFQLLQLAEEFKLLIVDDCSYADLLPSSPFVRRVPLAALDQLRRVIHIGSFSKTLGPGLRIGFIAAAHKRIEPLRLFKAAGAINNPVLGERLAYHLLAHGRYRRHCERLRAHLHESRERLAEQLRQRGMTPEPTSAGMYQWLSLGPRIDARTIATRLYRHGHISAPGAFFSTAPRYRSYMRLNVAAACDNPVLDLLANEVAAVRAHADAGSDLIGATR